MHDYENQCRALACCDAAGMTAWHGGHTMALGRGLAAPLLAWARPIDSRNRLLGSQARAGAHTGRYLLSRLPERTYYLVSVAESEAQSSL